MLAITYDLRPVLYTLRGIIILVDIWTGNLMNTSYMHYMLLGPPASSS
jgi:hypothetical protein